MQQKPVLTQSDVQVLVEAAVRHAGASGWKVTIVVCDDGAHPLQMLRLDGASPFTAQMALAKARTAALCRKSSKHYEEVVQARPGFLSAPMLEGMIEGGLPIEIDGHCVGSVGVSGVRSPEDAQIGQAGIDALRQALGRG